MGNPSHYLSFVLFIMVNCDYLQLCKVALHIFTEEEEKEEEEEEELHSLQ